MKRREPVIHDLNKCSFHEIEDIIISVYLMKILNKLFQLKI